MAATVSFSCRNVMQYSRSILYANCSLFQSSTKSNFCTYPMATKHSYSCANNNKNQSHCNGVSLKLPKHNQGPFIYGALRQLSTNADNGTDEQFFDFLGKEISEEKQEAKNTPSISGFTVETSGPNVKFTRKAGNETVCVEFNVCNSVSPPEFDDSDGMDTQSPEQHQEQESMVAYPPFTVTVSKEGTAKALSMRCELVDTRGQLDVPEQEEQDAFQIVEVAMINKLWTDDSYSIGADVLDPTMYDFLMLMLERRGVDNDKFCKQLVEYSTAYEHSLYVDMLQSMKEHLSK